VRILVADDDAVTRRVIERTVRTSGHEPVEARDGEEALQIATGADAPPLLLLDWMMPKMTGVEVCRRVRSLPQTQPYILMLSGRSLQRDFLEAVEAGADDYLRKPCPPGELAAKIRATQRWLAQQEGPGGDLLGLLRGAAQSPAGEVVVRQGGQIGRIYFFQGQVVWVHQIPANDSLLATLAQTHGVPRAELQAALEESRRSGRFFGDIFIEWKLLDEAAFREALRGHFAAKIEALLALREAASIFLPQNRDYHGSRGFSLDELLPSRGLPRAPALTGAGNWALPLRAVGERDEGLVMTAALGPLVAELRSQPGVTCVQVLDVNTGVALSLSGAAPVDDVTWSLLQLLRALGNVEEGADDVLCSLGASYHLARLIPGSRCAVLISAGKGATIAMIRLGLTRAVQGAQAELARVLP